MIRAIALALSLTGVLVQDQFPPLATPQITFEERLAARLPIPWRAPVTTLLVIPAAQQAQLLTLSDEALRQNLIRRLVRVAAAHDFVKAQLKADPSPRVRSAIL